MDSTLLGLVIGGFAGALFTFLAVRAGRQQRPETSDPWRTDRLWKNCAELPVEVIQTIANPDRLAQLRRDPDRLEELGDSIVEIGVERPLTVVIDDRGVVALKDGHSRLLVCPGLGYDKLPVKMKRAGRIRSHGRPAGEVLGVLLDR